MNRRARLALMATALAGLLACTTLAARPAAPPAVPARVQDAAATCSLTWPAHRAEAEACLRKCEIDRIEEVPIGVTKPKRVFFKEGSAVRSAAWKPLLPGRYSGYWESYKSEIAAYELDKLLGMDMVPPTVERRGPDAETGAMMLWVENVHGWDPKKPPEVQDRFAWDRQVIRMKMFDQLIANIDRNQGNLIYDGDFHLFLIDHSRAFTSEKNISKLPAPGRIDGVIWDKMEALTFDGLKSGLGEWMLGDGEIRALLERRDRMKKDIDKLVKDKGARFVFIR